MYNKNTKHVINETNNARLNRALRVTEISQQQKETTCYQKNIELLLHFFLIFLQTKQTIA